MERIQLFFIELRSLLCSLPTNSKVILCGDININLLDTMDNNVIKYENLLAEFGFIKCIHDITRREILNSKVVTSCLDHIFVRASLALTDSAVITHKVSDHYYVAAGVKWKQASSV